MKKLSIFIMLIISSLTTKAEIKKDTTIIEFNDKGIKKRLSVFTNGRQDFKIPSHLNLNNLLKEIGVDSSDRDKAIVLVSQNGNKKDTILVISKDGRKIKIVTNEPKGWGNSSRTDTLRNDETDNDYSYQPEKPRDSSKENYFHKNDFNVYLGFDNWHSSNSAVVAPTLATWGSRYFALSWRRNITVAKGKKADLALSYSPEVLWYNFMFDGNKYAHTDNGQIEFTDHINALSKSKLTVPTLNLPIMLTVGLKESRFEFGLGGYIGYTIDPYTKLKYSAGGKDKHHESYGLNEVRYGLTAEIGRKNGLRLFFRYDLNDMFKSNQVNAIRGWSFGFRLF